MFGIFKSPTHTDPELGQFVRSKGMWRGFVGLSEPKPSPLVLSGSKSEPDAEGLDAAKHLPTSLAAWRRTIEGALFEHYEPYGEAGDFDGENPVPTLPSPSAVWKYTQLQYVAVMSLNGKLTVEVGYSVARDPEHTIGARFQNGQFIELNGSVLQP